ncbi:hypothetical protein HanIR_Chr11g0546571 [Helianthus annuus]|nr:hypothetical protein HanIR_Chr11g0546571 [Helianthus annuus]
MLNKVFANNLKDILDDNFFILKVYLLMSRVMSMDPRGYYGHLLSSLNCLYKGAILPSITHTDLALM